MGVVYGRDDVLAHTSALLDGSIGALVIEGEAGAGKTAVLEEIHRRGTDAGVRVWSASPAEAETSMPFAVVADLLADEVLDRPLPVQWRAALDSALGRTDDVGAATAHALGRALLALLDRDRRTLIAIDNLQWVDEPSAGALAFVLRRLPGNVSVVAARRSDEPDRGLPVLDLPSGRARHLHVMGALPLAALERLVADRTGVRLSRPRLKELHEISGGNAQLALEIATAAGADLGRATPLPIPRSASALVAARLDALPHDIRRALVIAALAHDRRVATIEAVLGSRTALGDAVRAGLLHAAFDTVRVADPIVASVAASSLPPWEARELHARLAEATTDVDARAHHLAHALDAPDEPVAQLLDDASRRAAARGAPGAAASFAEAAARLSPARDAQVRRLLLAAELHRVAGDAPRARSVLEPLLALTDDRRDRARTLMLLSHSTGAEKHVSLQYALDALAAAKGDDALTAECHGLLEVLTWLMGDVDASAEHCAAAVRHARASGDPALLASALSELCHLDVLLGRPLDEDALAQALSLESELADPATLTERPTLVAAVVRTYRDELDLARAHLDVEERRLAAHGDDLGRIELLFRRSECELRAGRWTTALAAATELVELAHQAGHEQEELVALQTYATVAAHVGLVEDARRTGRDALQRAELMGDRVLATRSRGALGFLALSQGHAAEALDLLTPALAHLRGGGVAELSIHHVAHNALEAYATLGRTDEAEDIAAWIERCGAPAQRAWHAGMARRGMALVAAMRGDLGRAIVLADEAVAAHDALPQPFERARTLLIRGEVMRRARRRSDATGSLNAALDEFLALGAPLWAGRAAAELARVSGRVAERSQTALSQTERRVAELAAAGRTNKEIAAELFVTVRTVEANLTRVYTKLGVRSRTELAHRVASLP